MQPRSGQGGRHQEEANTRVKARFGTNVWIPAPMNKAATRAIHTDFPETTVEFQAWVHVGAFPAGPAASSTDLAGYTWLPASTVASRWTSRSGATSTIAEVDPTRTGALSG